MALSNKKWLTSAKIGAPQQVNEGFLSQIKITPVFKQKEEVVEDTYLNLEHMESQKFDFGQIWDLSVHSS